MRPWAAPALPARLLNTIHAPGHFLQNGGFMGFSGGVYTRTDGTRTGASVWRQARDAALKILAADQDMHDNDIATALSTCVLKDGTQTITADLPMNSHKFTGMANGTARGDSATVGQVQDQILNYAGASVSGGAETYDITCTPAVSLVDGLMVRFKAHANANHGATHYANVNGTGDIIMCRPDASISLLASDIVANNYTVIQYSAGANKWFILGIPYSPVTNWAPTRGGAFSGGTVALGRTSTGFDGFVSAQVTITGMTVAASATGTLTCPFAVRVSGQTQEAGVGRLGDTPVFASVASGGSAFDIKQAGGGAFTAGTYDLRMNFRYERA